ncbi:hypothetical protein QFL00_15395, partial [Enterococcus faecalis]|nr:hypothetical protein [Enterococcus faecalis]
MQTYIHKIKLKPFSVEGRQIKWQVTLKFLVQFQIANGMRIGELLAIKSDNINYEDKTLDIDGTINWVTDKETGAFGVKETTKTS